MFSSSVENSERSHALSEMSDFYDMETPGTFGVPKLYFFGARGQRFKNYKTGKVPGKPGRMGSLSVGKVCEEIGT
jgi:hypothetical protein